MIIDLPVQAHNERNFHVFYRLLAGCTDAERAQLALTRAEDYAYLTAGDCISLPGMDDGEEWQRIRGAMKVFFVLHCSEPNLCLLFSFTLPSFYFLFFFIIFLFCGCYHVAHALGPVVRRVGSDERVSVGCQLPSPWQC